MKFETTFFDCGFSNINITFKAKLDVAVPNPAFEDVSTDVSSKTSTSRHPEPK
jgi:hypothetical protein